MFKHDFTGIMLALVQRETKLCLTLIKIDGM